MTLTSSNVFREQFSERSLHEIVDLHLRDGVARGVDGTGYDGFLASRDAEVDLIRRRALSGSYRFSPFRQKLILKNATSPPRQVSIPTLRDRVALRALNNFLTAIFDDCRPQHAHPVISSVLTSISEMQQDDAFIKLDIKSFYDEVNHDVLMRNLRRRIRSNHPLQIIESALKTPTGAKISENSTNPLGIPQGLSISNILSSIYLKSIDDRFGSMLGLSYYRYVDDILCVAPSSEAEIIALEISRRLKREKKLTCHPLGTGKSSVSPPGSSVTYLGYSISRGKISVRSATEKKLMSNIMEIIFGSDAEGLQRALWRINLRITGCRISGTNVGWIFYFSQIDDISLLSKMDAQIRRAVRNKFGIDALDGLKRLVKAYHQAKYQHINSTYFPDFGTYTRTEMERHLELLAPGKFRNLRAKTDAEINRIFSGSVWREVKRMERDTLGSFS